MGRILINKKMMWVVLMLLPSLAFTQLAAQEPLRIDLATALEIALSENPTVKVADKEIEKKQYAKKGAYAALLPQINFTADYGRTLKKQYMYMDASAFGGGDEAGGESEGGGGLQGFPVGTDNSWSLGFAASMPLVNPALWKSLSITGVDIELAVEQARASKISMVNQVKNSYYTVLLAKDSYWVFYESYKNAMENYLDIKQKYDQGLVAEYDLIRADVSVKNVEPSLFQAENSLELAKWQLKVLMGMDLDIPIECIDTLNDFEKDLFADFLSIDTALINNTDLRQLDLQTDQLQKTLESQKYEYLPTLSLNTIYTWSAMNNDFKFKNYNWNPYSTIGVTLSIPIFSGGSRYNNVRQTKVSIQQMQLNRENTERNLQLVVKQQMDNMNTSIKQYDASRKGVFQAERGYEIAQKRYETGAGTLLELNDAELALTQARLNFNQSIYDYMVAKSDLENILGQQY
ncbi:MAG: TolC family protein [Tannerellaceae bacterium]|nr:TolC family protein [Tannerellaceae bacterium]